MWRIVLLFAVLHSAYTNPITSCEKLESSLVREATTFGQRALSESVELLQRIIDAAERLDPNEMDRIIFDEIATFIERASHKVDFEELNDLLVWLMDLLDLYYEEEEYDRLELDGSESLVDKLMRQFGFDTFEQSLERQLYTFMERTEDHIEAYLRRQNMKDSELPKWFTAFKDESDIEIKYLMLEDIIENLEC
ncbi:uncharacterized protein LOC6578013 [Drosophila mojavensis]|uniref:Uncharacterized protein n=1 Tax=Drosophila mojavensis TaxID=7230 RepID=B4KHU9_DROMO|nr:uncharacterized protein LOC6578013 [Drosophila mojavensis]EDW13386.1 uncharacterized protein Dmoj_GI18185 [Drosophila mojavensis]